MYIGMICVSDEELRNTSQETGRGCSAVECSSEGNILRHCACLTQWTIMKTKVLHVPLQVLFLGTH